MSRSEDAIVGRLDRTRARTADTARALQLRETAMSTINCAVMELAPEDRPDFIRGAVKRLREMYASATSEQAAVSLFGSMAWSAELQTRAVVARATAERLFTKAANDRGEG